MPRAVKEIQCLLKGGNCDSSKALFLGVGWLFLMLVLDDIMHFGIGLLWWANLFYWFAQKYDVLAYDMHDFYGCVYRTAMLGEHYFEALGITNITWEPNVKWFLHGSYPREWLILSAVMLLQQFVSYIMAGCSLNLGTTFRIKHALIPWFCAWWLKPPEPPPFDFTKVQWGEEWDMKEYTCQYRHKILHLTGFAEEYVVEYASCLDRFLSVMNMNMNARGMSRNGLRRTVELNEGKIFLPSEFAAYIGHMQFSVPMFKCGCEIGTKPMDVIFDTGATISFTHERSDFIGELTIVNDSAKGFTGSAPIMGSGIVEWTVQDHHGTYRTMRTRALYVPNSTRRLFSPQFHFQQEQSDTGYMKITAKGFIYRDPEGWCLDLPLGQLENLPTAQIVPNELNERGAQRYDTVLDDNNKNLTQTQKELLLWHHRLGHIGFQWLQHLMRPRPDENGLKKFLPPCILTKLDKTKSAKPPKCKACLYAKQRKNTQGDARNFQPGEMYIRADDLQPGQCVSVDQYESTVRGRLPHTRGREAHRDRYCGGTIFIDHATGLVKAYHQVSLGASDTLRSKRKFEQEARFCDVYVEKYHADNGIFTSEEFTDELEFLEQKIELSGVGAHHQNGVAERAIATIIGRARAMILHAAIHWPGENHTDLWPMAIDYAVFLWNHTPHIETGLSPIEIFCRSRMDYGVLRSAKVWGCPTYVLDPTLQDGHKLPKWKPRSRRGQFLGFSTDHASNVGLIRNLRTGFISPQFHVVHDEKFETIQRADNAIDKNLWNDLVNNHRIYYPDDDDDEFFPPLADDWLDDNELAERQAHRNRRHRAAPPTTIDLLHDDITATGGDNNDDDDENVNQEEAETEGADLEGAMSDETDSEQQTDDENDENNNDEIFPELNEEDVAGLSDGEEENLQGLRRNPNRQARGNNRRPDFVYNAIDMNDQFLLFHCDAVAINKAMSSVTRCMQYMSMLSMDHDSGEYNYQHPFAFATKASDADSPTWEEAMNSDESEAFWEAMDLEIEQLEKRDAWTMVDRDEAIKAGEKVLGSTWAFRRKRFPDGRVKKLKARICARGDQQVKGVDAFDTFSPVVSWSTVRLMLILSVALNLATVQVDYDNAFVQAELKEPVYMEIPRGYRVPNKILRLNKSLYGLRTSSKNFFDKLTIGMKKQGFEPSQRDPFLFLHKKKKMACVAWVDDQIYFAFNETDIQAVLDGMEKDFDLHRESDVAGFLGIDLKKNEDGTIELLQTGLIDRIITALGLDESKHKDTPTDVKPLGKDEKGEPRLEEWSYPSVIGMMLYLQNNSRPDITFAVNQCARFSRDPKKSHEAALKRIGRYLKGTRTQGMIIKPKMQLNLDCYADADFAGLWTHENPHDTISVKSRTGYIMTLGDVPVIWASKLQTEIAMSTMEAEYIAVSTAMKELIPLREVFADILEIFQIERDPVSAISTVWEDNQACLTLANTPLPRMTPRSKHIAIKYHWFRSHLSSTTIVVKKIDTMEQRADIFTKGLGSTAFRRIRSLVLGW